MQREGLQGNWALVVAYRQAPKLADGRLAFRENKKLMAEFNKTEKQVRCIIQLVRSADRQGIALDVSDRRNCNPGRPSELTPKIEQAMKEINAALLTRKIRTTRRRMQVVLHWGWVQSIAIFVL